jgi:hypothetical protein
MKNRYDKLNQEIRDIYDKSEVEVDWERRQYSKGKYDEMIEHLANGT